jgi:hypothetical protein
MLGYHSVAVVPNVALICRMHHLARLCAGFSFGHMAAQHLPYE